ncbi:hypothetical protein BH23GEM2_BH23GEM2_03750 [soil metagenome]
MSRLLETVTTGDSITVIFPQGSTLCTRQQYVDFHRAWFADTSWTMQFDPVLSVARDSFGVALFRTVYSDTSGVRDGLVSLTFSREPDGWRLVFDQNTRVSR